MLILAFVLVGVGMVILGYGLRNLQIRMERLERERDMTKRVEWEDPPTRLRQAMRQDR